MENERYAWIPRLQLRETLLRRLRAAIVDDDELEIAVTLSEHGVDDRRPRIRTGIVRNLQYKADGGWLRRDATHYRSIGPVPLAAQAVDHAIPVQPPL